MSDLLEEKEVMEVNKEAYIPPAPVVPEKEGTALVSTEQQMINNITQLANNPDVDVDKIDKLLDVQIKMMDRQAKMDYDQALARVQADMPRITENGQIKNKHGAVTSKYMKYEDIDKAIRPRLQKEGFSLMHTRTDSDNKMVVRTTLKHMNGHEESVEMPLPYDTPNQLKNAVQCAVSTFSYGKRVNVCSLLNIVAEGEDDDGQTAEANYISDEQAAEIKQWLEKLFNAGLDVDTRKFLKYLGTDTVEQIPVSKYDTAIELLQRKEKEGGES